MRKYFAAAAVVELDIIGNLIKFKYLIVLSLKVEFYGRPDLSIVVVCERERKLLAVKNWSTQKESFRGGRHRYVYMTKNTSTKLRNYVMKIDCKR